MRRPSAAARGASDAFSIISLFSRFLVYPDLRERAMCSGFRAAAARAGPKLARLE